MKHFVQAGDVSGDARGGAATRDMARCRRSEFSTTILGNELESCCAAGSMIQAAEERFSDDIVGRRRVARARDRPRLGGGPEPCQQVAEAGARPRWRRGAPRRPSPSCPPPPIPSWSRGRHGTAAGNAREATRSGPGTPRGAALYPISASVCVGRGAAPLADGPRRLVSSPLRPACSRPVHRLPHRPAPPHHSPPFPLTPRCPSARCSPTVRSWLPRPGSRTGTRWGSPRGCPSARGRAGTPLPPRWWAAPAGRSGRGP